MIVQKTVGASVFDRVYEYVGTNYDLKYKRDNRTGSRYFNNVEGKLSNVRSSDQQTAVSSNDGGMAVITELAGEESEQVACEDSY